MSDNYAKCYTVDSSMAEVYCDLQGISDSHKVFTLEADTCNLQKTSESSGNLSSNSIKSEVFIDSNCMQSVCTRPGEDFTPRRIFPLDCEDVNDISSKETLEDNVEVVSMNSEEAAMTTPIKGENNTKIFTVDSIVTEPPCGLQKKENGNWFCDICGLEEPSKDDILTHRILHLTDDQSKKCPICEKKFSSSTSLRNHLTVHTGIKKFRCKYCGRKFGWKTQLAIHENLHTGKGLHHCQVCSKSFMTKWLLHRHLKIHIKDKRKAEKLQSNSWSNDITKITSPQVYDKLLEISTTNCVASLSIESPSAELPKCRECKQTFKSEELLAYHLLQHNSIKQNASQQNMKYNVSIKNQTSIDETLERNWDISLENWSTPRCGGSDENTQSIENMDQEKFKLCNAKNPSKGSLTSIVSKLHHKVDEKQKSETDEPTEVLILQNSQENNFNSSLMKDVGVCVLKGALNCEYKLDTLSKDISKQPLSTLEDPFISGMELERSRESGLMSTNTDTVHSTCTNKKNNDPHCITNITHSTSEIAILKQTEAFQKEMQSYFTKNEAELSSLKSLVSTLHGKIDSLTNIVTSQSLLINRIVLGGKMEVNGQLDFNVRPSSGE